MSGPQPAPLREPPDLRPWVKKALLRWNSHYREYERIVASDTLSPALVRFLRFIVVETLDGRGEQLTDPLGPRRPTLYEYRHVSA